MVQTTDPITGQRFRDGGAENYGLARNPIIIGPSTAYVGEILGFKLLNPGTGVDFTYSPISGGSDITWAAADITAMGDAAFETQWIHCDGLTTAAGQKVQAFTPEA